MKHQENSHIDRRIIRTRKAIKDAFVDLLAEKPLEKITITALAQRADIDRKTFYTHYTSIDDLLKDYLIDSISDVLEDMSLRDLIIDPATFARRYLSILTSDQLTTEQHQRMFKHVPPDKLIYYFTEITRDQLYASEDSIAPEKRAYLDLILEFYLGGIFNACTYMLSRDVALTSPEAIETLTMCITHGLTGIVNRHLLFSDKPLTNV